LTRYDVAGAARPLQRQLDGFLRFTNDIGSAIGLEEHFERGQASAGAAQIAGGENESDDPLGRAALCSSWR